MEMMKTVWLLAQDVPAQNEEPPVIVVVVGLALLVLTFVGLWKVFVKAGEPGWAAIIPIYNAYVLVKIAGRPAWWFILFFIPCVSLIPAIIIPIDLAKQFGKGIGYGLGMIFLPFIFYPMLGFGDAVYGGGKPGRAYPRDFA